jgi:hypothetical protein
MRSRDEVRLVQRLAVEGLSKAEIVRATGIPYRTISHWLDRRVPNLENQPAKCAICAGAPLTVPSPPYVYLLGLSKHWPCMFPQHGPGMKHTRKIELTDWQQQLVDDDPRSVLRGLIHSDGTRFLNRAVGTSYPPYPRYHSPTPPPISGRSSRTHATRSASSGAATTRPTSPSPAGPAWRSSIRSSVPSSEQPARHAG